MIENIQSASIYPVSANGLSSQVGNSFDIGTITSSLRPATLGQAVSSNCQCEQSNTAPSQPGFVNDLVRAITNLISQAIQSLVEQIIHSLEGMIGQLGSSLTSGLPTPAQSTPPEISTPLEDATETSSTDSTPVQTPDERQTETADTQQASKWDKLLESVFSSETDAKDFFKLVGNAIKKMAKTGTKGLHGIARKMERILSKVM